MKNEKIKDLIPYLNIGSEIAANLIVFTLIGYWLDDLWKMKPVLLLTGAIIGIMLSIYSIYKLIKKLDQKNSKK